MHMDKKYDKDRKEISCCKTQAERYAYYCVFHTKILKNLLDGEKKRKTWTKITENDVKGDTKR